MAETKSMKFSKPSGRTSCSGRAMRNITTSAATASTTTTDKKSRVRRAGNTLASTSVSIAPSAVGITKYGVNTSSAKPTKLTPP
jgi:hypothetical protein